MSQTAMVQSDSGGVAALKGFTYQNLAAAYYVLHMLHDKTLISVRCEVVDDIDLVYEDRIEYVQVKTTDSDYKWCVKEFAEANTKTIPPTGRQRVDQIISQEDSILHKSILCDKDKLQGFFRILTARDVTDSLKYLKIPSSDRVGKAQERNALLKRLTASVSRNRKQMPDFLSLNGNDTEYWIDHAEWTVIPNRQYLELLCTKLIHQSAHHQGVYLSANEDPERILASLLKNVTDKGADSRVLKTIANKSYHRSDFIKWFNAEIEYYTSISSKHVKIYETSKGKLNAILSKFFSDREIYDFNGGKLCAGLHGQYHQRKYSYGNIANSLHKWLPEVLLLPSEIADNTPQNLIDKFSKFTKRYNDNALVISSLISKVLLHSTIRTEYKSQPISAELYIDDGQGTCFDNAHIVLEEDAPDKLIMGFSELVSNDNAERSLIEIVDKFDELISSEAFQCHKEKILTAKDDSYLLQHDIDEILSPNRSLDDCLNRFKFLFFIGYESNEVKCHSKELREDYLKTLREEVVDQFKFLIDQLILKNVFCEDLDLEVYLYPIPSLASLISAVQEKGESNGL